MYGWNSILKRTFDLCIGVPVLLLSCPVLALVACLVKLTLRGPVFYCRERMGFDGTVFRMVKFRTMRDDAERETGRRVGSRKRSTPYAYRRPPPAYKPGRAATALECARAT